MYGMVRVPVPLFVNMCYSIYLPVIRSSEYEYCTSRLLFVMFFALRVRVPVLVLVSWRCDRINQVDQETWLRHYTGLEGQTFSYFISIVFHFSRHDQIVDDGQTISRLPLYYKRQKYPCASTSTRTGTCTGTWYRTGTSYSTCFFMSGNSAQW
jgi:hypothetical protein